MILFEINSKCRKSHLVSGVHSPRCKLQVFEECLLLPIPANLQRWQLLYFFFYLLPHFDLINPNVNFGLEMSPREKSCMCSDLVIWREITCPGFMRRTTSIDRCCGTTFLEIRFTPS